MLTACIGAVLGSLRDAKPEMGQTIAIDGSDLPAYGNGQRYVKRGGEMRNRFADPDASWGHWSSISTRSGGGYYGYKIHAAVCTATGLPVAWQVETAKDSELPLVPVLLDAAARRGFTPDVCVLDRGYDAEVIYTDVAKRHMRPSCRFARLLPSRPGKTGHRPAITGLDVRGLGRQAGRVQVALPVRPVRARVGVGQGKSPAPADPTEHGEVQAPVPPAGCRRARVRPTSSTNGECSRCAFAGSRESGSTLT